MITPQIIIAGIQNTLEKQPLIQRIIRFVEEKFIEMDIKIIIAHEEFSSEEFKKWIEEISTPNDFFLNIQANKNFGIQFLSKNEEEIASRLLVNTANRLGILPSVTFLNTFSEENFLRTLPLHVWNIVFPSTLSEKQLILNIMACITDIYTTSSSLLLEEDSWPFRDVPSSHFAFNAIKKAKNKKIIAGYKGDIIYPNGGITRGEVFYILDKLELLE